MLKNIPSILSPELLKILMEMGHGDEIVIADGNFPGASIAKNLVRLDGHGVPQVLDAVVSLMPLDAYVKQPVGLMQVVKGDNVVPTIWNEYEKIINLIEPDALKNGFEMIERFEFYERAKNAYAVIMTGESAIYANIILKKGVVKS
ncbi:MAG: RbsD/FucU domain-containing protein [bacterium]|nr:RbsD/FucU domain-containing protein [bacterium]